MSTSVSVLAALVAVLVVALVAVVAIAAARWPSPPADCPSSTTDGDDDAATRPAPPPTPPPQLPVPPRVRRPMPYTQIGLLQRIDDDAADGAAATGAAPRILPLYGRRVDRTSHRFHYRTRTGEGADGSPALALVITDKKGRDCTNDRNGCDEAWDGSVLTVRPYGSYRAEIYSD